MTRLPNQHSHRIGQLAGVFKHITQAMKDLYAKDPNNKAQILQLRKQAIMEAECKFVEQLGIKYSVTKEGEYFYRGFLVRLEAERA
jgi:hypothetical protein